MFALLTLIACSPYARSVDPWVQARAACFESADACDAVMAEHLGLTEDTDSELSLALLDGMFELLLAEPPPVSELRPEPWLSEAVLDELDHIAAVVDTDHSGQVLYDLVAAQVRSTEFRPTESGTAVAFQPTLRELRVDPDKAGWMDGAVFAHALVHEGAHAFTPHHVACSPEEPLDESCDADWDGAYAFQVAAAGLLYEACDRPEACGEYLHARDAQQQFILAD